MAAVLLSAAVSFHPAAADPDAGRVLYEGCAGCHGEKGISSMDGVPSLAGQPDVYTQWQLIYYRIGRRKNEAMTQIVGALSNDDIRNLGGYLETLPPLDVPKAVSSDLLTRGREVAVQNKCAVCHGDSFEGKQGAARLAGQREDYLLQTLRDLKDGKRQGQGLVNMTEILGPIDDADLPALAKFVSVRP